MNNTSTPDSWASRIEQASKILGIDASKIETILSEYGVKEQPCGLEMLSDDSVTPFGDMRKIFCDDNEIAVPLLRMAIKHLRGPKDATKTDSIDTDILALKTKYGVETKLEDLGIEQLLSFYDPKKVNAVHTILKNRYGRKSIIAFKPDMNIVAQEETINYVCDLESGFPEEKSVDVDGELVRLYPIGQTPNELVLEDPLFAGHPLKRERSIVNRVNWENVELKERQFFRILVNANDINRDNRLELSTLLDKELKDLKEIFPEAYMTYKELKAKDELPKLTMSINDATAKTSNNPFDVSVNKTY